MHTGGYEFFYFYTPRSKGRAREEHEPLTYEQMKNTWYDHLSTGSKGHVHDEHEPLNDKQMINSRIYRLCMQTLLYEIAE
jgi:hypothetical protein